MGKWRWLTIGMAALVAFLLVPLLLYLGAYFSLVQVSNRRMDAWTYMPDYRMGGTYSETIFALAYRFDVTIRPNMWETQHARDIRAYGITRAERDEKFMKALDLLP